jgi:hypothetical protein
LPVAKRVHETSLPGRSADPGLRQLRNSVEYLQHQHSDLELHQHMFDAGRVHTQQQAQLWCERYGNADVQQQLPVG